MAILLSLVLLCTPMLSIPAQAQNGFVLTYTYTDVSGNTVSSEIKNVIPGSTLQEYNVVLPAGQEFKGWFKDEALTEPAPPTMPENDLTLYGKISYIEYTVTYILTGGDWEVYEQTGHLGEELAPPAVTVAPGYRFTGWTDADSNLYGENATIPGNLTLKGAVEQKTYTIEYILDGKKIQTPEQHYVYDEVIVLHSVTPAEGTSFSGWFTDEEHTSPAPSTMTDEADGVLTLYGSCTANLYTITYVINGKTEEKQQYTFDTQIDPIHTYDNILGYSFSGWKLANGDPLPEKMPANDLTAYATFTAIEYTVTYVVNTEPKKTERYTYGETINYLKEYENVAGYSFSGWKLSNGETPPKEMPAHNLIVFGTYVKEPVIVLTGGTYKSVIQGTSQFNVVIRAQSAPYITKLTLSDLQFDSETFILTDMQWLDTFSEYGTVDLREGTATLAFEQNTSVEGKALLQLTFEVNPYAEVGERVIGFTAAAESEGFANVKISVTPASMNIICGRHDFTGEITSDGNGTHAVYCANGCGEFIKESCLGGVQTCLARPTCSICGSQYDFKKPHSYSGAVKANEDNPGTHSRLCVNGCGEYGDTRECSFGNSLNNKDQDTHTDSCTVCGYSKTVPCFGGEKTCLAQAVCEACHAPYGDIYEHSYTGTVRNNFDATHSFLCLHGCNEYGYDQESASEKCHFTYTCKQPGLHTMTCTVCNYTADAECSGGKATCLEAAVCEFCKNSYGDKLDHDFSRPLANEDGTHSMQCANGCDALEEAVPCTPGSYLSVGDGTHKTNCTVCDALLTDDCTGGTATCEEKAVCAVCNSAYGTTLAHVYTGEVAPNGDATHSATCINGCKKPGGERVNCTYGTWASDGENTHSRTCTVCGDKQTEDCTGGTAACDKKAICEVCNTAYGNTPPHTPTGEFKNNEDGTHTRFCTTCQKDVSLPCSLEYTPNYDSSHTVFCPDCGYTVTEDCFGGKATCLAAAVCDGCKESHGDPVEHDYSGTSRYNNDGTHSLQCRNGCEQYGDAIACSTDSYTSNGNDTHSGFCTGCNTEMIADCTGGTATCEEKAICEVCNKAYGNGGRHLYDYKHNETHHWPACTRGECTAKLAEEEHDFSEWQIVVQPTQITVGERVRNCSVCGYTQTEQLGKIVRCGDTDANGTISADDARFALRLAVKLETASETQTILCDADEDGAVTAADARKILRAAVQLEDTSDWQNYIIDSDGNIIR